MGDDGTMTKGTRCMPEFKAKAVRLLTESRGSYSSETKAIEQVAKDLEIAPESLRRRRDKADATGERGVAAGERDFDDGVGFFRGQARPDTALMSAYIDEYKGRFGSGRYVGFSPNRWIAGSSRLAAPHVQIQARQPHGRQA